jgi:hypothetical protein
LRARGAEHHATRNPWCRRGLVHPDYNSGRLPHGAAARARTDLSRGSLKVFLQDGGALLINAGGSVVLAGSRISASGVLINAASIEVDQRIDVTEDLFQSDAIIGLTAASGSIRVTKALTTRGTTDETGGDIGLAATGDISIEAPIDVALGTDAEGVQTHVDIQAGGNVDLDRVTINSFNDGGNLTVTAGGSIVLHGDVAVVGKSLRSSAPPADSFLSVPDRPGPFALPERSTPLAAANPALAQAGSSKSFLLDASST